MRHQQLRKGAARRAEQDAKMVYDAELDVVGSTRVFGSMMTNVTAVEDSMLPRRASV